MCGAPAFRAKSTGSAEAVSLPLCALFCYLSAGQAPHRKRSSCGVECEEGERERWGRRERERHPSFSLTGIFHLPQNYPAPTPKTTRTEELRCSNNTRGKPGYQWVLPSPLVLFVLYRAMAVYMVRERPDTPPPPKNMRKTVEQQRFVACCWSRSRSSLSATFKKLTLSLLLGLEPTHVLTRAKPGVARAVATICLSTRTGPLRAPKFGRSS